MSSPPPTKPPRGVKQGKETSGLLLSVIRTLSATQTNAQREKERAKLEKEYKKSDARLDELVAEHAQEIMDVMQELYTTPRKSCTAEERATKMGQSKTESDRLGSESYAFDKFSNVGATMSALCQRSEAAGARLAACRALLRVRRDDLRRLWAEARTHHYALQMLTDIEKVVVSERQARAALSAGRVLSCAHTLSAALDANTANVTALHTTRRLLETKKVELVEVIVRRVSEAVYRGEATPLTRRVSARRRTALLLAELTKSDEVTDAYLQDITPEYEASLTDEDKTFETTVMISLEALGVLGQLKEATEKFKVQIQNELLEVIECVSRRIIDDVDLEIDEGEEDGDIVSEGVTETGRPLARLVANLAEEFRACATRNRRLLQLWRAALQKYRVPENCLHTEQHYWSAVQQVLQLLLTEYLDIESVNLSVLRGNTNTETGVASLRITDYFAKKRPQQQHRKLFKLQGPTPASPSSARSTRARVSRPDPAHLHAVLPTLHALCAEIEPLTGGGECSLRAFITDYVRTGESERLCRQARAAIEAALRANSAWKEKQQPPKTVAKTNHRYILTSIASCWHHISETVVCARRCGACGGAAALRASVAATAAVRALLRAATNQRRHAAAKWLDDTDIVRFLQTLPNWKAAIDADASVKIDEQELKHAYEREAEILGTSLGDGVVNKKEITSDVAELADMALLCETMDWLAANIRSIPTMLTSSLPGAGAALRPPDKFLKEIEEAAAAFQDISHKCLLFLHLEVRIECFHYLGQEETSENEEEGGGAAKLTTALLAFHEHAVLAPNRMAYVLNGLGEMMSAALRFRYLYAGDSGGVGGGGTAARLRHCLAALQLPHAALDAALHYARLLPMTHQEIIASIREKGPGPFSELEYLNAFKAIGARLKLSEAEMRAAMKDLSSVLGHVGVTV